MRPSAKYHFTRAQQDAFATESVRRAVRAVAGGEFDAEITPLTVKGRKGETRVARDETPGTCDINKITTLKPAVRQGRHGHGGQLLLDLRRRGGPGAR